MFLTENQTFAKKVSHMYDAIAGSRACRSIASDVVLASYQDSLRPLLTIVSLLREKCFYNIGDCSVICIMWKYDNNSSW